MLFPSVYTPHSDWTNPSVLCPVALRLQLEVLEMEGRFHLVMALSKGSPYLPDTRAFVFCFCQCELPVFLEEASWSPLFSCCPQPQSPGFSFSQVWRTHRKHCRAGVHPGTLLAANTPASPDHAVPPATLPLNVHRHVPRGPQPLGATAFSQWDMVSLAVTEINHSMVHSEKTLIVKRRN